MRRDDMRKDLFFRQVDLDRAELDEEKREIELSFSSETPVKRWFGSEILLHGEGNIDLSRLRRVGSLIFGHNAYDLKGIIGPVRKCWLDKEKRQGRALVGFDEDETGTMALGKVKSRSLRGVSFGYRIDKGIEVLEKEEWTDPDSQKTFKGPAIIATRWTPYEITLTPIPADANIGVGRDLTRSLEGIEIERGGNTTTQHSMEEGQAMTKEEFEKMLRELLPEALKPVMTQVVAQVRAAMTEENQPRIRVNAEEVMELNGQAAAISPDAQIRVGQLVAEGKNADHIRSELLKLATKKPDANDTGDLDGDGTGLGARPAARGKLPYASIDKIPEDMFVRMVTNPALITFQ